MCEVEKENVRGNFPLKRSLLQIAHPHLTQSQIIMGNVPGRNEGEGIINEEVTANQIILKITTGIDVPTLTQVSSSSTVKALLMRHEIIAHDTLGIIDGSEIH